MLEVFAGKKIILAITGSIAAYKSVYLLRLLKKAGADVQVVTTPAVSHFVGELTWASLSGKKVFSGLWSEDWSAHVEIGTWADLMIVAPATANTLAKMAHGQCDNALLAVYLAARCPVLVAPAMDADMYIHPTTTRNLASLSEMGVEVLPVGMGFLASGLEGPGRLMEPDDIFHAIQQRLLGKGKKPLEGKRVVISAGPTQEAIDPVRFLTNHASGKMGFALARAAQTLGAEVSLVTGPTQQASPWGVARVDVKSAAEMAEVMHNHADADVLIMTAAVADYRPENVSSEKIKKKGDNLVLNLTRTTDILAGLGAQKQAHQVVVGFALETQNERQNAQDKLDRKNLDLIVLNSLRDPGAGFGHDTNIITLIDKQGEVNKLPPSTKIELAHDILQKVVSLLPS